MATVSNAALFARIAFRNEGGTTLPVVSTTSVLPRRVITPPIAHTFIIISCIPIAKILPYDRQLVRQYPAETRSLLGQNRRAWI